jgi:hypothetical protein
MGLMSALGIGSVITVRPAAIGLLLLPLTTLFLCARKSRIYGPFILASAAAVGVYLGKFTLGSDYWMYLGGVALFSASIWNIVATRCRFQKSQPNICSCPR